MENQDQEFKQELTKSLGESQKFKQKVMSDMKNGLSNAASNLFYKEENLLIHKKLGSLNQVKWFIRILFLIIIPINIFIFIFGANNTFSSLRSSVNKIYVTEIMYRNYLRSHHSITSMILYQNGAYNNITDPLTLNNFITQQMTNLQVSTNILISMSEDPSWNEFITQDCINIQANTTMSFLDNEFENIVMPTYTAIAKIFNSLQDIVIFRPDQFTDSNDKIAIFRLNIFQNIFNIIEKEINNIIQDIENSFNYSESMSLIILITEATVFVVSFLIILHLILNVISCLKIILEVFSYIDPQNIKETQWYYRRLTGFFKNSKGTLSQDETSTNTKFTNKGDGKKNINGQKSLKKSTVFEQLLLKRYRSWSKNLSNSIRNFE